MDWETYNVKSFIRTKVVGLKIKVVLSQTPHVGRNEECGNAGPSALPVVHLGKASGSTSLVEGGVEGLTRSQP
jgi:hypothetical protein